MPVARIISSSFEDALQFADYLRPLFDTVEIAQPGRASDTAVDLEVNLELCTPQEAWRQIAELSQEPNGEIFVAPGVLFPEAEQPATPELEPGAAKAAGQVLENVIEEVGTAIEQASAAVVTAAGSNGSGTHKAPSVAAAAEEGVNWLGRARESLRQWLAVRALLRQIRQIQQQEREQEQQRQRQMALQFERDRRDREVRELAVARLAEQEAAIPETEQPALESEAILQRQATEEEERRQAEQEEAIRRGRFVEEILRRRAQEQAAHATLDADTAPVEFETVQAASFAAEVETAPMVRFGRGQRSDRLRAAMALAGVTSVLLTVALVGYAHRQPASPVPASVLERSSAVEQKVPFGPAIIPAAARESARVEQTPMEAVLESPLAPEKRGFQRDFRRVRVDRHEVDYVADDVTVRHFTYGSPRTSLTHPPTTVPVRVSSDGVKQISDME